MPIPHYWFHNYSEVVASLRADVDGVLEMSGPMTDSAPMELAEDTMFAALFTTTIALLSAPCEHANRIVLAEQ